MPTARIIPISTFRSAASITKIRKISSMPAAIEKRPSTTKNVVNRLATSVGLVDERRASSHGAASVVPCSFVVQRCLDRLSSRSSRRARRRCSRRRCRSTSPGRFEQLLRARQARRPGRCGMPSDRAGQHAVLHDLASPSGCAARRRRRPAIGRPSGCRACRPPTRWRRPRPRPGRDRAPARPSSRRDVRFEALASVPGRRPTSTHERLRLSGAGVRHRHRRRG